MTQLAQKPQVTSPIKQINLIRLPYTRQSNYLGQFVLELKLIYLLKKTPELWLVQSSPNHIQVFLRDYIFNYSMWVDTALMNFTVNNQGKFQIQR